MPDALIAVTSNVYVRPAGSPVTVKLRAEADTLTFCACVVDVPTNRRTRYPVIAVVPG